MSGLEGCDGGPIVTGLASPTAGSPADLYRLGAEDAWNSRPVRQGYGLRTAYMDGYANGQAFSMEEQRARALGVPARELAWYLGARDA